MKSRIIIATFALLALTTLSPAKAKAWGWFTPPPPPVCPSKPTTTLPIDNSAGILMIAGILIGSIVLKKSSAELKTVPVKA